MVSSDQSIARPDIAGRSRLEAYLSDALGVPRAEIAIARLHAGHSNLTFMVTAGTAHYVLRTPPEGPLPPSAHDVIREHTILSLLSGRGARIPRPVLDCSDAEVIGADFYLMERVEGEVVRDHVPALLDVPGAPGAIAGEFVDALTEIHAVDWRAARFDTIAPVAGYLERQLRLWRRQWAHNRTRTLHAVDALGAWLDARAPRAPEVTIVHGDYKLDNVIFDLVDGMPRAAAIVDWEMATLGDPLADVGYMLALWSDPGEDADLRLGLSRATAQGDFPSRAELIDRYATATGRDVTAIAWYQVLALWKLAILLEGSYKRHLAGTTEDPWFSTLESGVPMLLAQAQNLCDSHG